MAPVKSTLTAPMIREKPKTKWKTQPEIYHMSPPQIAEGTPKVGTEPADSHQEAKPTANKLADS